MGSAHLPDCTFSLTSGPHADRHFQQCFGSRNYVQDVLNHFVSIFKKNFSFNLSFRLVSYGTTRDKLGFSSFTLFNSVNT